MEPGESHVAGGGGAGLPEHAFTPQVRGSVLPIIELCDPTGLGSSAIGRYSVYVRKREDFG